MPLKYQTDKIITLISVKKIVFTGELVCCATLKFFFNEIPFRAK